MCSSINTIVGSADPSSVCISKHLYSDEVKLPIENATRSLVKYFPSVSNATSIANNVRKISSYTAEDTILKVRCIEAVFEILDMHLLIKSPSENLGGESKHAVVESKDDVLSFWNSQRVIANSGFK
mmetsp:Transcript_10739/g.13428  ORF Transcript_10739/g.13428 Transcript_10739/m.13428 type:complete len:126 (+) Transcript_10739:1946-2323(+)